MVSAKRLSGINPLAYVGVEPVTPAPLFVKDRSPTINDYQNFNIGTFWLVSGHSISEEIWMLVALEAGIATWVQLYPGGGGGGGANTFPCDVGVANEAGGVLNVFGDTNIVTTGAGNTITLSLAGSFSEEFDTDSGTAIPAAGVIVIHGGINMNTSGATNIVTINLDPSVNLAGSLVVGTTSQFVGNSQFDAGVQVTTFNEGVVQSDNSGNLFCDKGTDGQVLIGSTAGAPAWANITSLDTTVTITNGSNSIDLSVTGGTGTTPIAFLAQHQGWLQGIFTVSPDYSLGTQTILTVFYNVGSAFTPGNGIGQPARFTAPITGKYQLQLAVCISFSPQSSSTFECEARIVTPSRSYSSQNRSAPGSGPSYQFAIVDVCADLTMGDVVTFIASTTSAVGGMGGSLYGGSSPFVNDPLWTYCSGFLAVQM